MKKRTVCFLLSLCMVITSIVPAYAKKNDIDSIVEQPAIIDDEVITEDSEPEIINEESVKEETEEITSYVAPVISEIIENSESNPESGEITDQAIFESFPVKFGLDDYEIPVQSLDVLPTDGSIEIMPVDDLESYYNPIDMMPVDALESYYYPIDDLPDVRNQNPYGSCWAHSSMILSEMPLIKQNRATKTIDLSELFMAWAAFFIPEDPLGNAVGDHAYNSFSEQRQTYTSAQNEENSFLNHGGSVAVAVELLSNWIGPVSETEYPCTKYDTYTNNTNGTGNSELKRLNGFTQEELDTLTQEADYAHLQSYYVIDSEDADKTDIIKQLVKDNGAVSMSFWYDDSYITEVEGGNTDCYFTDIDVSKGEKHNHAVTIVGWDDDFSKDNFNSTSGAKPENDGAYLVRNSWGFDGVEQYSVYKYFWIPYEEPTISVLYSFIMEPSDNYDNIYYYDGSPVTSAITYRNDTIYGANIFKAKASDVEGIKAVSFETYQNTNVNYEVKIYLNPNSDNPSSGELKATKSGNTTFQGTYTVKLDEAIPIDKGDTFSVVVKFNKSGDKVWLPYEASSGRFVANSNALESFYSSDGVTWNDMYESNRNNLRISAYTDSCAYNTITFNANGGKVKGKDEIRRNVVSENAVGELPVAVKTGYSFDGWFDHISAGSKLAATAVPTEGKTYYAHWTPINYTATINTNGGTGSIAPFNFTIEDITPPGQGSVLSPVGKVFDGYYAQIGGETYYFDAETSYPGIYGDITLFMEWVDCTSHSYGDFVLDSKASVSGNGSKHKTCSKCRKVENYTIAKPSKVTPGMTEYTYNGAAYEPAIDVYDSSNIIIPASNYDVSYSNNVDAGNGVITVTFKEASQEYTGTITGSFTIEKATAPPNKPGNMSVKIVSGKKVSDIELPANWEWTKKCKNELLPTTAGKTYEAYAVYNGADKGNYENIDATIIITIAPCDEHVAGGPVEEGRVEATCTEDGYYYTVVRCTKCNSIISKERHNVDSIGHSFINYVSDDNGNCIYDGTKSAYCENGCGAVDVEAGDHCTEYENKHSIIIDQRNVIPSTCTEAGGYDEVSYCEWCNNDIASCHKSSPLAEHSWDGGVITKESTYYETGIKQFTCGVCGKKRDDIIEKKIATEVVQSVTLQNGKNGSVSAVITLAPKDSSGGALCEVDLTGKMTVSGKKVVFAKAKEMPVVTGYTFKGWYVNGKKVSSIPANKLSDMTVEAVYDQNIYNITYKITKPKGAKVTGKLTALKKIKYNDSVVISTGDSVKAYIKGNEKAGTTEITYQIAGFTDSKTGTEIKYKLGETVAAIGGRTKNDKNVILYPVWKEVK